MLKKIFLLLLVVGSNLAVPYKAMCTFEFVGTTCSCSLLIHNPTGSDDFVIGGNPIEGCGYNNTLSVSTTGETLNVLPVICESFPLLESIVMSNMGITTLKGNPFNSCNNLKKLNLRNNRITEISALIFSNTKLETLDLYNNSLQVMHSEGFSNLRLTKTLNLQRNSGIVLPSDIFNDMTSLVSLDLRSCNLAQINGGWFLNLRNLNTLYLASNVFTSIPQNAFSNLNNLQTLDMSNCRISNLPGTSFTNNVNLRSLFLQNNQLTSLVSSLFSNQHNLEALYLSNNQLTQLPNGIFGSLSSLITLGLATCKINEIGPALFSSTRSLQSINLEFNNITEIPIGTFISTDNLQHLYLSGNKIGALKARSFGKLRNLYTLGLSNNLVNEVDYHFMNQSVRLNNVVFTGNLCTQISVSNFIANKANYLAQMVDCFDNFDRNIIVLETYNSTCFDWHNIRPNDQWESIRVSIQAYESAHIGLKDSLETNETLIEIRFGERDNHESHIFERGVKVFHDDTHYPLNATEMRTFYIGWRFGIVMVYREEERYPFMAHYIREPFPVNFFGLRSQINDFNSVDKAIWNVTRIKGNVFIPMANAYKAIAAKLKLGMPVDLKSFLI